MSIRKDEINLIVTANDTQAGTTLKDLKKEAQALRRQLERIPIGTKEWDDANKKLQEINKQSDELKAKMKGVGTSGSGAFGSLGAAARGLLTALGPIAIGLLSLQTVFEGIKKLFNIGQDAEALKNKMQSVFGDAKAIVIGFSETNAEALGLSRQEYQGLATDVGDLLVPMGFTKETAAKLSTELVNQAGVLSRWSKGKVDTTQATEILNKSLLGERDALNSLGIDIKQSTVDAELKRRGLADLTGESKRQAEALITLDLITKQSQSANEGFAAATEDLTQKKTRLRAVIQETASKLGAALVPAFNKVLGVVIPVVEWVISFGTRLVDAYQKADTFRGIVTGVFTSIANVIGTVASGIANISEGFLGLFEGNFSKALDSFKAGFNNLDPINIGKTIIMGVKDGFNSVKFPTAEVKGDPAQASGQGKQLAHAYAGGLEGEFAKLKANGQRDRDKAAKEAAKDAKEALDQRLKEAEIAYLKEELVLETQRQDKKITELQFGNTMVEERRKWLERQLDAYKEFGKLETKEALNIEKELLEIRANSNKPTVAPLATLSRNDQRATSTVNDGLNKIILGGQIEETAIRDKFKNLLNAELEYEIEKDRIQSDSYAKQLALMEENGLKETKAYKDIVDQKKAVDESFTENKKRLAKIEDEMRNYSMEALDAASDFAIQLLSRDEAARKKNAAAIKSFQIGEVIVSGIAEIAKIFKQFPGPLGLPVSIPATIAVAVRSAGAVAKIASTKFYRGGFTGPGFGAPDETGHRPVGVVHANEYVSPPWMVQHPEYRPVFNALERIRRRGYAEGGYVTPTDPALSAVSAGSSTQNNQFAAAVERFTDTVRKFPKEIKSRVVYTELENTANEVNDIRNQASL